ncbi:MAG: hypothetical protein U0T68_12520 [Ferruginibacter sp.]
MKKLFLSILTLIYMATASGIAMDIHYCMGKRAGVDFYGDGNDKCGRCGMKEKKNGCCHDEHQFHKIEDSHKNVSNDISFQPGEALISTTYYVYDWLITTNTETSLLRNNSPPLPAGKDACIFHCVFRL